MSDNRSLDRPVSIEEIVTRYLTRYRRLDELIPYAFNQYNATSLNLYIDLYGLYRTIYSRRYRTKVDDYRDFTVLIIDLCAHYRGYFKYLGVSTKIFLIQAYNIPKNNLELIPNYNKDFRDKLQNKVVDNMVKTNVELLGILCPYLPDIHFIQTQFEATTIMDELIRRESINSPKTPHLIISSDAYPMQLCSLYDNVGYLWPSKWMGQDRSMIVCPKSNSEHKKSFWLIIARKMNNFASEQKLMQVSTSNFVLLESLHNFNERNISPTILNITSSINLIHSIAGDSEIRLTPDSIFNEIKDSKKYKLSDEQKTIISNRYKCLDEIYQRIYFNESLEPKVLHYENLNDPDAIRLINSKYFVDNPMDITRL